MSDSPKSSSVRITITAGDPGTEIFLIDSNLQRIAQAVGVLNTEQPAGLYQVKLRAGTNTQEDLIKVGKAPFERLYPPLAISSPVPLMDTHETHEFHVSNAEAHSNVKHVGKGSGSFIYVFARDWTSKKRDEEKPVSSEPYVHPARGLTLIDKSGVELVNFEVQSAVDLKWEPWAACNVEIDPGSYILRLNSPDGSVWERTLVASPNWQTQCFLLQRYFGESKGPDLAGATILVRKKDLGFRPGDSELRLVELARLALINERPILSNEVEDLLTRKFENPLLGIFGAHLLMDLEQTRGRQHEPGLLKHVVQKLRNLLREPHPDVEALAYKVGLGDPNYRFEMPPMIRRSWTLMTHASAQWHDAIPLDSLNTQIYDRILAEEPWLVWSGIQHSDEESPVLESLALYLEAQQSEQEALAGFEAAGASEESLPVAFDLPQSDLVETNEVRDLTMQLNIPRSVVEQSLPRAKEKAKVLRRQRQERSARRIKMENNDQWCFAWVPQIPATAGKTKGTILKDATWQVGEIITVSFLDGDTALRQRVSDMAQRWTAPGMANLSFDFLNHNNTDIRISFKNKGSWSLLGKYCRNRTDTTLPTMNYGWLKADSDEDALRRVVLHEFGHALGFIHEHQSPLNSIQWNRDAVIAELQGPPNNWSLADIEINMFNQPSASEIFGTPVDRSSIMMYPIPSSWTQDGFSVGLNTNLSPIDIELAKQVYPH